MDDRSSKSDADVNLDNTLPRSAGTALRQNDYRNAEMLLVDHRTLK